MNVRVGKTATAATFPLAAKLALQNNQLRRNVHHATNVIRGKRTLRVEEMPDWQQLRQSASDIKAHTLAHLDQLGAENIAMQAAAKIFLNHRRYEAAQRLARMGQLLFERKGQLTNDHSYDDAPTAITPSEAIRTLLGFLQFTPGGLVRTIRGSDKAGPLANTAAVLPIGSTLNETLCLSLHPSPITDIDDLAAWEHPPVELANLRADPSLATGANDRYTRLSRAALLQPEDDGRIQWIHFAAGIAMGDDINSPDPMASYRASTNALVRLTFREGHAFWRDLPALVPDAEGKAAHPAAVLGWRAARR